jgi:hypothetical protein
MAKDQEWLRSYLNYDPDTGVFTWRVVRKGRPHGYIPAGTQAGSIYNNGYRVIVIEGKRYLASRLACLYMTGKWPRSQMDHHNRDRSDDRWDNLRPATPLQNTGNRIHHSNNALGIKGVCWEADRQKFKAYIEINGRSINLGRFDTAKEAQAAYGAAAKIYFGEFARTEDT